MGRACALLSVAALAGCGRIGFEPLGAGGDGSFARLRLVQANDLAVTPIADLGDGARIDVSDYIPAPGFAVEAVPVDVPYLLRMEVNGGREDEYQPPYVSAGDNGTAASFDRMLRVGSNDLLLQELSTDTDIVNQLEVSFVLEVPISGAMSIASFALVDPSTGASLAVLSDGARIPIGMLATPSGVIAIETVTSPAKVGGVDVQVSGALTEAEIATWPPYRASAGGFAPAVGSYTMTATPLERGDGTGTRGSASTISFSITP